MHASLLMGVLLLFSRHVLAAPSDDRGVGEPQHAAGGILHHMRHTDVYDREIQKRPDGGSWPPDEFPDDDTQSPAVPPVEAPEEEPANDQPKHQESKRKEFVKYERPEKMECRDLKENKYVPRDTLIKDVNEFCKTAIAQGKHDEGTGGIGRTFHGNKDKVGTADEVIIGLFPPS
ncbi:hypothetical protein IMZ48_45130 [Candidatus Bathyarchaeota archaeon]|nr:hypothetical protein [Candidatus Bathyarchaeota archaeon]